MTKQDEINRAPARERSKLSRSAAKAVGRSIRAGAAEYDRARDLPGLIRADPFAAISRTADGVEAIVAKLERALRAERNRARAGHWAYDLNRHIALHQACLAERALLASLRCR